MLIDIPDSQIDLLIKSLAQQPWGMVNPLLQHILPQLQKTPAPTSTKNMAPVAHLDDRDS